MRDFFKNQYVLHSLGAIAVIVVLVAGFLFWLKGYTRLDQTTPTPDLQGMDATLAVQTLEAMGFRWTIIDSSRYEPDKRPRAVLSQDPSAGTAVKEGRKIYLKINRSSWETVSVPAVDFENDKIENVAKRLQAVGFIVGDTIYRPHIGRDVVLGLSVDGVEIHPGDQFPKATVIDLIAGEGDQPLLAEDTLSIEDF